MWDIGETWMFPTAKDQSLGTGKTALGPAALGISLREKWTAPLGFDFDSTTICRNKKPLRYGAELYYYASHREKGFDPKWQFRMFLVTIIASPDGAQSGVCGNSREDRHCCCKNCIHRHE